MHYLPQRRIRLQDAEFYDKVTKIETSIIERLNSLRKTKSGHFCEHFFSLPSVCENYNAGTDYYQKFWKMFLSVEACKLKITMISKQVNEMNVQLKKIQNMFEKRQELRSKNMQIKQKIRRKAQEITRQHQCSFRGCNKAYGSQLALKLHIKMKHVSKQNSNRGNNEHQIYQT